MKPRQRRAREIQAAIGRILWEEWDPIGMRGSGPDDEYNAYVGGIYGLLARGADKAAIVDHLYRIETDTMGSPGDPTRLGPIADSLLKLDIGL